MRITLLCSDPQHPVNAYISTWAKAQAGLHEVDIIHQKAHLKGGEMLFLVSCTEIISASDRSKYVTSLVLHASDLPKGRGWSPHIWELAQGAEHITLSLIEAEDRVDSGCILAKTNITVPKHALWNEINSLLFKAELDLIEYAVHNFGQLTPQPQTDTENPTYYPKRTPRESQVDVNKSISEQFDLIRVCDPNRFPAHFEYLGQRFILKLEKFNE